VVKRAAPPIRPALMGVLEAELFGSGFDLIAGADEAGRGPLAGPVVAACVVLEKGWQDPGVADSKAISPAKREILAKRIKKTAAAWAVAECSPREIESLNILKASLLAMKRALSSLKTEPDFLLIDGNKLIDTKLPQRAVIKGDATCRSVACASILAKTRRDAIMCEEHNKYPAYNFAANKGYPTAEHRRALMEHGPCPIHRRTYGPVAQCSLDFGIAKPARPSLGREAENLAAAYLEARGYDIVARNQRTGGGELDLVAQDGEVLVFVEVKARSMDLFGNAAEAVDTRKQKRLIAAAQAYLAENCASLPVCRFDVMCLDYSGDAPGIEHMPDAFRMED
jgi:ribonuclease HII